MKITGISFFFTVQVRHLLITFFSSVIVFAIWLNLLDVLNSSYNDYNIQVFIDGNFGC